MTSDIIYSILLFISGCVIIHLYRKNKMIENISLDTTQKILEQWDETYLSILETYGSCDAYVDAHMADYNIYRSNVLTFISKLRVLSSYITKAFDLLELDYRNCGVSQDLLDLLESLRLDVVSTINNLVDSTTSFVEGEEEAHTDKREVKEILDRLDKEIKEINFYEQKEVKSNKSRKS